MSIGSVEMDEIGEVGGREANVGVRESVLALWTPGFGQVDAFVVNHGERGSEVYVCSCCANHRIDRAFDTISGYDTCLGKVGDTIGNVADVGFRQSFEIARSWC